MGEAVLTNVGEAWAAGRMAGTVITDGHFLGWGTGDGTVAKGDSVLFLEATESRVGATVSVEGTAATAAYKVEGTLTANSAKTITNAGNFTAASAGTLIVHASFDGIPLEQNDTVTFVFTVDPS